MENWIKVNDYDIMYEVSDMGQIRNSKGKTLGSIGSDGYVHLITKKSGKYVNVRVHKIIWKAFKGDVPDGYEIDHINGNKSDNRINNLQLLNHKDNTIKSLKTSSGIIGINWDKTKQRWSAQITLNGKRYKVGHRKTIEDALFVYNEAQRIYDETGKTPDQIKAVPVGKRRCTSCNEVLDLTEYDSYITSTGKQYPRPKCKSCYSEYRKLHDKKYRSKIKI